MSGSSASVQVLVDQLDMSLDDAVAVHPFAFGLNPPKLRPTRVEHQGLPAVLLDGEWENQTVKMQLRSLLVVHGGYLYELRIVRPETGRKAPPMDELYRAASRGFAILSGPVRPPPPAVFHYPDRSGPGWRVKDGVFESAASGLRVKPPPGWRLLLGSELDQFHPDAEFGLQQRRPPIYMAVVSERAGAGQLAQVQTYVRTQSVPMAGGEHRALRFDGRPLDVVRIQSEVVPASVRVFHGMRASEDRLYQVVFGLPSARGFEDLQAALDAVTFLDPGAREALIAELARASDMQTAIDDGSALWGGRFRAFERGITWVKPSSEWKANIGASASAHADNAILAFEHSRHGIMGYLLPMQPVAIDARELLRLFVGEMVSEGRAQQIPIHPLELEADSSATCIIDTAVDGMQMRFALAAAVVGDRGVLLAVTGLRENMSAAGADVQAALNGLALSREPLPTHSDEDGTFTSWRFGYRMAPPDGSVHASPKMEGVGSAIEVQTWSTPTQSIILTAVLTPGIAQRAHEVMPALMAQHVERFRSNVKPGGTALSGGTPEELPQGLAGQPGLHTTLENQALRTDVFATHRGDQLYVVMVLEQGPERSLQAAQRAIAGFSLLE
jgi:hypothetical protein